MLDGVVRGAWHPKGALIAALAHVPTARELGEFLGRVWPRRHSETRHDVEPDTNTAAEITVLDPRP